MDDRKSTSAAGGARGYKRSWKNLLINKRYQLRFTLFMVGMAALLMTGLGWWVMQVANEATEVAASRVRGDVCPTIPAVQAAVPEAAPAPAPAPEPAPTPAPDAPAAAPAAEPALPDAPPEEGGRRQVVIEETSMTITPTPAEKLEQPWPAYVADHYKCEFEKAARLEQLDRGRMQILWVLIASGLVLVLGLAVYGIKMTHKVAGPLYKISLYMGKMRDGRLDKVYNLRKGDQLVDFYEHFKTAHQGIVDLEKADIDRLRALLASSEKLAGTSPEVDAAIADLRAMLARKEKSLE